MISSALPPFDKLSDISMRFHPWRLKVRVISLWKIPEHILPLSPSSFEMVLIDNEGVKIDASVCKNHPIRHNIVEGRVYKLSYFRVVHNIDGKRYTSHEHRLFLHSRTKIVPTVDDRISHYGWNFFHMHHIRSFGDSFGHLVDVIGYVAAASSEKLLIKDNRVYKTMDIYLLDNSGIIRCNLVGDIVDTLSEYLCSDWVVRPVVGLRYVDVKRVRGNNHIQCVPYVSKIYVNHVFEEDGVIGDRFVGLNPGVPVEYIGHSDLNVRISAETLDLFPRKTIPQLLLNKEKGIFIVHACIESLLKDRPWSYPSCRCHTELEVANNVYRCNRCFRTIGKFIHRYRLKVEVFDGYDSTVFVLNDREVMQLTNIPCEKMISLKENPLSNEYPQPLEEKIVGKEMLFKIRAGSGIMYNGQEVYDVIRICEDTSTIEMFNAAKFAVTPLKAQFAPPFTKMYNSNQNGVEVNFDANMEELTESIGDNQKHILCSSVVSNSNISHLPVKRKLEKEFEDASLIKDNGVNQKLKFVEVVDLSNVDQELGVYPTQNPTKKLELIEVVDLTD